MLWCVAQMYSLSCRKPSELTALSPLWGLPSLKELPTSRSLHILKDSHLQWCVDVGWGEEQSSCSKWGLLSVPELPWGEPKPLLRVNYSPISPLLLLLLSIPFYRCCRPACSWVNILLVNLFQEPNLHQRSHGTVAGSLFLAPVIEWVT